MKEKEIKITPCSYCAKCLTDFIEEEIVDYIKIDNNCVCTKCSDTISAEKEKRIYKK